MVSMRIKKNYHQIPTSYLELCQIYKVKRGVFSIISEIEVRYPRFLGNSFLALPVLKTGYKYLDILLEFKPTAKYGLLFFSAEFEDARSDFFSVALINGFIEFRYF